MILKKETLQKPTWISAIAAFIFGMAVHLFGMVNCLHNYDDISVQPFGYGTGLTSGRWFLTLLGSFFKKCFGNHNIPLFNGVVFILLLAVSAGLLVSIFEIKSRRLAVLVGMLFVVFPSATAVMFFTYTAIYYGIAILLSVLAVWILPKYKLGGLLLSALFTALSLGIYQAYMPLTVAFFVLMILRQVLTEDVTFWKVLCRGLYACFSIVLGLILYFLLLKVALAYYDTSLSTYQGLDSMGSLDLKSMPGLIWRAITSFCKLPINDYCNIAQIGLLKLGYIVLALVSAAALVYCLIVKKKKISIILMTLFLCAAFPVAVNLIVIMCPDSWIYTLMVYGFVAILWVPVVLVEALPLETGWRKYIKPNIARVVGITLAVMLVGYSYLANVNYVALHYANRQMENYVSSIVTQVRMTEGYDASKKWAMVGKVNDPLFHGIWDDVPVYGGNANARALVNAYSRNKWFATYVGYAIPVADDAQVQAVKATEAFKNMPCWPSEGSIMVIDDLVVIKFQD